MSHEQGADERRIRQLLRRQGVGPDAEPQPTIPAPRDPDWLDRLYADDETKPAGESGRWWTVRKDPTPEPAPVGEQPTPGVHVTITPTAPNPQANTRRTRLQWWTIRRGTAAAIGWWLGLGPHIALILDDAGPAAIGVAVMFWLVAWRLATWVLRLVPREATEEVHTAADWVAHIPSATVLLALALNTPGVPS